MNFDDSLMFDRESLESSLDEQKPIYAVFINGKIICDGREKETVEKVFETLVEEYEKEEAEVLIEFGYLFDRDFSAKDVYKALEVERDFSMGNRPSGHWVRE